MGAAGNPLWPYVRALRHYDISGMPAGTHIGLPSPAVTLVLPLGAPLDLGMPDLARRRMTSCVSGLHEGPAAIHHDGTQRGIQADLAALGLRALFGVPAGEVHATAVGLDDLVGRAEAQRLLGVLESAPDWPARCALAARYLAWRLRRSGRAPAPRPEVIRAWNLLAGSGGAARIGDVAADVGWSARHLGEQFAAEVGTTPKAAARVMRFHRSVTMLSAGAGIADTAARCGFADQAHLTREWRRLAGTTPARWPVQDVLANVQDTHADRRAASTA